MAPGLGCGEHGEGYVRIGLVENTQRLRQATRNIRSFLLSQGVPVPVPTAADAHLERV